MAHILWIIGNGFDRNIGLKTSYRSFLDGCYLKPESPNKYRDELIRRCGDSKIEGSSELWSDLEELLGSSSENYQDDEELFHDTFEDMQKRFVKYIAGEAALMPSKLPIGAISEFNDSVCDFYERLTEADKSDAVPELTSSENISVSSILLNYTTVFDAFWFANDASNHFKSYRVGSDTKFFFRGELIHLHGVLNEDGSGSEIIFGISDREQISASSFAEDLSFQELWIKSEKNSRLFGNNKTAQMSRLVHSADAICVYGCSLGLSDSYIWKEVASRLQESKCQLFLFDHELPNRELDSPRRFQKRRNVLISRFLSVSGVDRENSDAVAKKIFPLESSRVFRFGSLVDLHDDEV